MGLSSRFVLQALVTLLFAVAPVFAQSAAINGQIEGTVVDATGAPVGNTPVSIRNTDTGFHQEATTSDAGLYRFPLLPLGRYAVNVTALGFAPFSRTGIVLQAGSVATVDVTLSVAGTSTQVDVTEDAPIAEPSRTAVGSTLSTVQVTNLPLVSRNPYNFILIQPNVSGRPNTEFGVPRKVNANGFNGRINYLIDGGNNTESDRAGIRLIPFSNTFVQEIENVNNGFAPEFGNTVGTVFNTITKSGTNALHGEGAYLFRRTDFSARPALLAASRPTPETNVDTFFGNAGGRIVRDKLFFFAGVEHVKRDIPQTVNVAPSVISQLGLPGEYANAIPFGQHVLFYLGKLDWQINQAHRLSVRFSGHRNDSPYNATAFGITVLSQTYNFVDRSYAGSVQLISTLSARTVNELRVQIPYRSQQQLPFAATGLGPSITIPGIIQFGGSPALGFIYKEVTPEVYDNISYNPGSHSFRAGFAFRAIRDRQTNSTSATFTFPSVAAYLSAANGTSPFGYTNFAQQLGQPSITYNLGYYSAYAQDNWKVRPNITLVYGLRYDVYNPPDPNKQAAYEGSRDFSTDRNNFAPRLGVAIGLGHDQKTVLRASTGVFYDQPQTNMYWRALLNTGALLPLNVSFGPSNANAPSFPNILSGVPANVTAVQSVDTVSRNFRNLYSYNANVAITRQLSANTAVTVTYLFTRGNKLPVYRNINLIPSGNFLADGRPIFGTGRIDPRFNNIAVAESVGQSTYNGGNITVNHRFARGLDLFATYTYSHSIDDAPEQNNIDSAGQFPSDPTNRRRDRGNSLTDRRHALTASGVWNLAVNASGFWGYLVNHNQLSGLFTAYAGDVFNIGSNQILNGDASIPSAQQRPLFIGRNTVRGPSTYQLDLRYSRFFPVGETRTIEFLAEATNLLNHDNITGVNTTARVDAAGNITAAPTYAWTAALDQRLVQLGFRFRF